MRCLDDPLHCQIRCVPLSHCRSLSMHAFSGLGVRMIHICNQLFSAVESSFVFPINHWQLGFTNQKMQTDSL